MTMLLLHVISSKDNLILLWREDYQILFGNVNTGVKLVHGIV